MFPLYAGLEMIQLFICVHEEKDFHTMCNVTTICQFENDTAVHLCA